MVTRTTQTCKKTHTHTIKQNETHLKQVKHNNNTTH